MVFQRLLKLLQPSLHIPEIWRSMPINQVPFLAIDLELTSLDAATSNILSIGWVTGKGSQMALQSGYYRVIKSQADLQQSPVIHGLIGEDIDKGQPVRESLQTLLDYAHSHVWVFHCSDLDMSVLMRTFAKLELPVPSILTLDTLRLALYQIHKHHGVPAPNAATLTSCRQRYNLPLAPAHNALDDAQATLELLFAQLNELDPMGHEPLSSLHATGALKVYGEAL